MSYFTPRTRRLTGSALSTRWRGITDTLTHALTCRAAAALIVGDYFDGGNFSPTQERGMTADLLRADGREIGGFSYGCSCLNHNGQPSRLDHLEHFRRLSHLALDQSLRLSRTIYIRWLPTDKDARAVFAGVLQIPELARPIH